jgi:hypothetical protein
MEDGRVIERGDHEQLVQACGAYYDIVLHQMESTGKDGEDSGFASLEPWQAEVFRARIHL